MKKLYKIEFLTDNFFGNSKGETVRVEEEDSEYIYYTDGFDRWCCLEKKFEGVEYKKLALDK